MTLKTALNFAQKRTDCINDFQLLQKADFHFPWKNNLTLIVSRDNKFGEESKSTCSVWIKDANKEVYMLNENLKFKHYFNNPKENPYFVDLQDILKMIDLDNYTINKISHEELFNET